MHIAAQWRQAGTCCASLYSILADTPVVWVLIIFFAASVSFQSYLYLKTTNHVFHGSSK